MRRKIILNDNKKLNSLVRLGVNVPHYQQKELLETQQQFTQVLNIDIRVQHSNSFY